MTSEGTPVNRLLLVQNLIDGYEDQLSESEENILQTEKIIQDSSAVMLKAGVDFVDGTPLLTLESCRQNDKGNLIRCADLGAVADANGTRESAISVKRRNEERVQRLATSASNIQNKVNENIVEFLPKEKVGETDISLLLASGITRFGILFVVIYLVQILVSIYRYSSKLSAHYYFLADGLALIASNSNGLGQWETALSAQHIDFGKSPVSPAQHVVEVVKAFLSEEKKSKDN